MKPTTLTFLFIALAFSLSAQKKRILYLDEKWAPCSEEEATYYREDYKGKDKFYYANTYYISGRLQHSARYLDKDISIQDGVGYSYYEDAKLMKQEIFIQGKRDSSYMEYTHDGELLAGAFFRMGKLRSEAKRFYPDGSMRLFIDVDENGTGTLTAYHPNGKLHSTGTFEDGFQSGKWQWFNENGQSIKMKIRDDKTAYEKRKAAFENERQKDGRGIEVEYVDGVLQAFFDAAYTSVEVEEVVEFPEVQASFPGGERAMQVFVAENVVYPEKAIRKNIQSNAYLSFVVESDGSISNVKYEAGHKIFRSESVRVLLAMPKWTPGEVNGKKVRTRCRLPIIYSLD